MSNGAITGGVVRVRIFVDFWNFQLSLRKTLIDWEKLGPWLTLQVGKQFEKAGEVATTRYEGLHVYASYNPNSGNDTRLKHWLTNTLDRFPGVEVVCRERKAKGPPRCPACHAEVSFCPACQGNMRGTVEKGIDTAIVTDMIRMAWEESFDVAVLLTSDRDFIPAVEFLNSKGRKVVNGFFPPRGMELAKKCWANIQLPPIIHEISRS